VVKRSVEFSAMSGSLRCRTGRWLSPLAHRKVFYGNGRYRRGRPAILAGVDPASFSG
jgi:hypothetical protein